MRARVRVLERASSLNILLFLASLFPFTDTFYVLSADSKEALYNTVAVYSGQNSSSSGLYSNQLRSPLRLLHSLLHLTAYNSTLRQWTLHCANNVCRAEKITENRKREVKLLTLEKRTLGYCSSLAMMSLGPPQPHPNPALGPSGPSSSKFQRRTYTATCLDGC